MFPALVNCTTIDWFSEWPNDALKEVAMKYLNDADLGPLTSPVCSLHHLFNFLNLVSLFLLYIFVSQYPLDHGYMCINAPVEHTSSREDEIRDEERVLRHACKLP